MMDVFYNRKECVTHIHTMEINRGGDYGITNAGRAEIVFVNGKFSRAHIETEHSLSCFDRNTWRIYAAVEDEISRIEASLRKVTA